MLKRAYHVTVCRDFAVCPQQLWVLAGNPRNFTAHVPMLRRFAGPREPRPGDPVTETHTILAWPQDYAGCVVRYRRGRLFAMATRPLGRGPCPLPHTVSYLCRPIPGGTRLEMRCAFRCEGLLALPLVPLIVRWAMRLTLRRLVDVTTNRVQQLLGLRK